MYLHISLQFTDAQDYLTVPNQNGVNGTIAVNILHIDGCNLQLEHYNSKYDKMACGTR